MIIVGTLSRLLLTLALCGMLSAPFARQAVAVPLAAPATEVLHDAAMEDMLCCHDRAPSKDCAKTCPLMAMCATQFMHVAPFSAVQMNATLVARAAPASDVPLAGLDSSPRPKPPKFFA